MASQCALGIAARRGRGEHALEFRNDQIEDLRGLHLERALLEEEAERIGGLVARDLEDALVDTEDDDSRRLLRLVFDLDDVARLDQIRRRDLHSGLPRVEAHRERHDAIRQRARVDLVRRRIANEGHGDVTIAVEIRRQLDLLHRRCRRCLEPLPRVDPLAFDGDEACACVWRLHLDLDVVTLGEVLLVQRQLQLGVLLERATQVGLARDRVLDFRDFEASLVAQHQRVVARRLRRQRLLRSVTADCEWLFREHDVLLSRLVFERSVLLSCQHRDELPLDGLQRQFLGRGLLRLRVDRDEVDLARGTACDVSEIAVALVADEIRQVRHQLRSLRGHAAAAIGFEALRQDVQSVCRAGEAPEIQVELGFALVVGFRVLQLFARAFLRTLRIVERVVAMRGKRRIRGRQCHRRGDATVLGRRAEQVLQVDPRLEIARCHPAFCRFRRQPRAHLQSVRRELLHLHHERADLAVLATVFHDVQVDAVIARRRGVERGVTDLLEPGRGETNALALHRQSAGIEHLGFERNARQLLRPVVGLDDHSDVDLLAGTIDAAIGEQIRRQRTRIGGAVDTTDVEAREIELAVAAIDRDERRVAALPHDVQRRRLLAGKALQIGKAGMAERIGGLHEQRQPVLAENLDRRAGNRVAGVDRLDENILAVVDRFLHQDAKIGHDDKPLILRTGRAPRRRIPALDLEQEDAASCAVGKLRTASLCIEIARQIDCLILRLARRQLLRLDHLCEALGHVRVVEVE